jgi:FkbM family methyltransferase
MMTYRSHIGQDQWVAEVLKHKRGGFFLDFGSLDGVLTNNTYVLETELGWNGICVEPNPTYYPEVCRSRRVTTVNAALWPQSRQKIEMLDAHGLSSVTKYSDADKVGSLRAQTSKRRIQVDTINPTELLDRFSVPTLIDYMSLDVEGCELDVLEALDLNRYRFGLMTIEHGEIGERQMLMRNLLLPLGYQVLERFYDDWFYHPAYLSLLVGEDGIADPVSVFQTVTATYQVVNH